MYVRVVCFIYHETVLLRQHLILLILGDSLVLGLHCRLAVFRRPEHETLADHVRAVLLIAVFSVLSLVVDACLLVGGRENPVVTVLLDQRGHSGTGVASAPHVLVASVCCFIEWFRIVGLRYVYGGAWHKYWLVLLSCCYRLLTQLVVCLVQKGEILGHVYTIGSAGLIVGCLHDWPACVLVLDYKHGLLSTKVSSWIRYILVILNHRPFEVFNRRALRINLHIVEVFGCWVLNGVLVRPECLRCPIIDRHVGCFEPRT